LRRGKEFSSFILHPSAFSLLEVMVATAIFFTCTFAILQLISLTLHNARALQVREPNAGMLAAEPAMTNRQSGILKTEQRSGEFKDYPGYTWSSDQYPVSSNGLYETDFTIRRRVGRSDVETHMSILLFAPKSPEEPAKGTLQ